MQMLLSVLEANSTGQEPPAESVMVLEPELRIRQSTAAPRTAGDLQASFR